MSGRATILHADLDAFFASVEQRDNPAIRGRPVIVGTGVVLAASYEAKAMGVRTAMNRAQARRLCPAAVVVAPRMDAYVEASRAVFAVFDDTTPLVEGLSIDEAFLDVGGLLRVSGTPFEIATRLRAQVMHRVGLPITVGVARTKFLAKVASAVAKPDGLLVVDPDHELDFLHPLPVEALWGVGKVSAAKLHARGLRTVGDVARVSEANLAAMLGSAAGHHLHALAHGLDPRPVEVGKRRSSIGAQHAFGRPIRSFDQIDTTLVGLVDRTTSRLRDSGRTSRTVMLRFRYADFTRATRSRTLPEATSRTATVLAAARALLAEARGDVERRGLTLVGITVANLDGHSAVQGALEMGGTDHGGTGSGVASGSPDDDALDTALDGVRDRFGTAAVTRAVLLGRDPGWVAPLLPD